jgi:hypothetical protein
MASTPEAASGKRRRAKASASGTVRKNFNLPQAAIDRAQEALGTRTETETVLRALETAADLAAFRVRTDSALARLIGKGGFEARLK